MDVTSLQKRLEPVFKKHKIRKAILFGSFARGESSAYSDVDLILVKRTRQRFFDRFDPILLELNLAIPEHAVDILIYTPQELERISNRSFIKQALREGRILYTLNEKSEK